MAFAIGDLVAVALMYALLLGVEDPAGTKAVRLPVVFVPMRLIMYFRIPRDEGGRKAGAMLSILP